MDTSIIYMLVSNPTTHTYVTFNEDGSFQEHYSLKRARLARPEGSVRTFVARTQESERTPHPYCTIPSQHGEHMLTLLETGARVDCPGRK